MKREILGLVMIALALAMVYVGRPRQGEVVGFMRGSHNFQSAYTLLIICLVMVGAAFILVGYNAR